MNIDTSSIISVTDANQNFSRLAKLVERNGKAYIFKNNKPRFMMLDINNQEAIDETCREFGSKPASKNKKKESK